MLRCFFGFTEHSDVDQETALAGAQGFQGCLSAVQLSHVAPLKAALRPSRPAPITVSGHVTESSCVAQAGTDATSRERTHSFAGGSWLFLYPVTNTTCPQNIKIFCCCSYATFLRWFLKIGFVGFVFSSLSHFFSRFSLIHVGHRGWHCLSLKLQKSHSHLHNSVLA